MHLYEISTGKWFDTNGKQLGQGYSGNGLGKNNPGMCDVSNVGPVPVGTYTILFPRTTVTHGPYVLPLVPAPSNEMHERSGFLIHGDSIAAPGTASQGCIILPRAVRESIWASGDHELQTVSTKAISSST